MKVIDNFLSETEFFKLKEFICSDHFPWYYNDCKVYPGDGQYQFTHVFYVDNLVNSSHYEILTPILNKLDIKSLIRAKANLTTKTSHITEYLMHCDEDFECKTSIFYVNTNNGYTKFDNEKIVNSVENRLVKFNTLTKHCGTTCTNSNTRIVLNFTYF